MFFFLKKKKIELHKDGHVEDFIVKGTKLK